MESWQDKVRQLRQSGLNWIGITELMHNEYFPELSFYQAYERIRHLDKSHHRKVSVSISDGSEIYWEKNLPENFEKPKAYGANTLVFSDTHMPFNHPNYLQFLKDTYAKYNCGSVVCLGDLVDNHAISRHQTETCAKSPYDELDQTISEVAKYVEAFPRVKMVFGNHDLVAVRQAATIGIGERFLKSFSELLKLPDTWELADEYIVDDVLYKHGINCMGVNGAMNAALRERMSVCIGHTHSNAGISYAANKRDIIFGAHCGCGIDVSAYAFAYGCHSKNRPILGCAVVFNSSKAEFIPMDKKYFRD